MACPRIARLGFALAMIALPFTYAVKDMLGLSRITWVDPAFVLALGLFALVGRQLRNKWGWFLIILAFWSAVLGWYLHKVEPGHFGHPAWFVVLTDPATLTLNLILFWVCIIYFVLHREFATRWLSISAICQLAIAVYLYFAMFGFLPVPASVDTYLKDYRARQVVWLASGGVPRMGGSFDESPMFGLFMLSCFVVLLLEAHKRRAENRTSGLITAGAVAAAAGALGSLSDQVLIGAAVIFVALALERMRKPGLVRWMVMLPALALVVFEASRIYAKREAEAGTKVSVYAESLSEREFKARYALKILADEPAALFFGIGPSRFGDYAISSPMYRFESTVQPSTTAVEWFIGYGFIGFIAITLWLYKIGKRAWAGFGYIGLAALFALLIGDMFQARWLWEGWFMALAYLFASPAWARPRPARAASTFRRGPPSGKAPVNPGSERVGDAAGS